MPGIEHRPHKGQDVEVAPWAVEHRTLAAATEIEHIEEIAKRRRVEWHVRMGGGRLSRLRLVRGFRLQFRSMNLSTET